MSEKKFMNFGSSKVGHANGISLQLGELLEKGE